MAKNTPTSQDIAAPELFQKIVTIALEKNASDIHIQPEQKNAIVRCRIDGFMHNLHTVTKDELVHVISHIKTLANLDITENRKPQDGRLSVQKSDNSLLHLRISLMPTAEGESVVIRLLDSSRLITSFEVLGLNEKQQRQCEEIIAKPFGLILATGPTGSGKTTTLFTMLNQLNKENRCVTTLEDPIEYNLPMIRQSQINTGIGFDFADGLRALFRQNPDIILVGEIRDKKTVEIAIRAAMTGHMILSSLHTNSSAGALIRMREMGLEKYMITSATSAIITQRLVRTVCANCKTTKKVSPEIAKILHIDPASIPSYYYGEGCDQCNRTGYQGVTGIFEILVPSPDIDQLLYDDASEQDIHDLAHQQGMQSIREHGLEKVMAGITTLEEVARVTI